jgi:sugar phosphate isomerase/epimerase
MGPFFWDENEYAISSWTLERLSLDDALGAIARSGFGSVEIWADTVHFDPRCGIVGDSLRKRLGELSLEVHSVHGPFRNFPRRDDEAAFRDMRQDLLRKTIDACSDIGAPIMVAHALDRNEYNYRASQRQIVGDILADLCEYGRRRGVAIALENIPPGGGEPDELPCALRDHVRNFPGIGLKYCLDIGHALLSGIDVEREIDAAGKDLVSLHVHNNAGAEDSHDLPTRGRIDWPAIRAYLRDGRYEGRFVLEVQGGDDPLGTLAEIRALFDGDRERSRG